MFKGATTKLMRGEKEGDVGLAHFYCLLLEFVFLILIFIANDT